MMKFYLNKSSAKDRHVHINLQDKYGLKILGYIYSGGLWRWIPLERHPDIDYEDNSIKIIGVDII